MPTTFDVFNAIAEPRRREIIDLLADGRAKAVTDLVDATALSQSAVSKHLGVLRAVGIVSVRRLGRNRLYSLQPKELRPVHDWAKQFERFWSHQLDRIKQRAERKAAARGGNN